MATLIKDATIISNQGTFVGDLKIVDGVISKLASGGDLTIAVDDTVINAEGLHLLPGIIDPQVHFRDPGSPDKETLGTGSIAAVSGGVTSFLDMPNNNPAIISWALMKKKLETAAKNCVNNHGFFIGATPNNLSDLQQIVGTRESPKSIPGICGTKIFMGSSTGDLLVHQKNHLTNIFQNTGGLIAVHAESEKRLNDRWPEFQNRTDIAAHAEWRDSETALEATRLAVELAQEFNHRLHVLHLTSGLEANWLNGKTGDIITTETLPQHLTFTDEDVERIGTRLIMNPPIRYSEDRDVLLQSLEDRTIQCIATDHAPHTLESKKLGWPKSPSGMPGVETSLPVMLTHAMNGKCSVEDVVKWMSTNVAKCYQMQKKGEIKQGNDADLVLVDLFKENEVQDKNVWTKVGWSPFSGRNLVGWPQLTIVNGTPVFKRDLELDPKGELLVQMGQTGSRLICSN